MRMNDDCSDSHPIYSSNKTVEVDEEEKECNSSQKGTSTVKQSDIDYDRITVVIWVVTSPAALN